MEDGLLKKIYFYWQSFLLQRKYTAPLKYTFLRTLGPKNSLEIMLIVC